MVAFPWITSCLQLRILEEEKVLLPLNLDIPPLSYRFLCPRRHLVQSLDVAVVRHEPVAVVESANNECLTGRAVALVFHRTGLMVC